MGSFHAVDEGMTHGKLGVSIFKKYSGFSIHSIASSIRYEAMVCSL